MPYSLKNSKVHSKKIAHLRKKYPIFELKETCINTQDCKKKIYWRKEWCMFKHIYTCSTFCMHSSYKPIRNIKFVYVLFTANSIKQQDYGQIGKDDSTAVIKNYIVE